MIDLLTAQLPAGVTVVSADDLGLPLLPGPLAIVTGGAATPTHHRVSGTSKASRTIWRVVCVSNTVAGAAEVASIVCAALNGARIDGQLVIVRHVSDPIEDRDDPSQWRWSVTVEATHY